jgi:hypothetical protein
MGWLFYHSEKNAESNDEHFAKKFDNRYQMVAHGTVGAVFYAALRDLHTDEVSAFIALTAWRREHHNFGYKDMTETMGPGACAAPKKVLDALTETTNEHALECRANCRRYHEQHAFLRTHLKPGIRLRLTHPLHFTNDTTRDTFTYTPSCGRVQGPPAPVMPAPPQAPQPSGRGARAAVSAVAGRDWCQAVVVCWVSPALRCLAMGLSVSMPSASMTAATWSRQSGIR